MAPRHFTNPAPKTESARAAAATFYCSLCQKGYSRQNEYQAHEASYEHNHNVRRKELKNMNQQMSAATSRSKKNDERESGMKKISINLGANSRSVTGTKVVGSASSSNALSKENGVKAAGTNSSENSKSSSGFRINTFKIGAGSQSSIDNNPALQNQDSSKTVLQSTNSPLRAVFAAPHHIFLSENDLYPEGEADSDAESFENAYSPLQPTGCDEHCALKQSTSRHKEFVGITDLMYRDTLL